VYSLFDLACFWTPLGSYTQCKRWIPPATTGAYALIVWAFSYSGSQTPGPRSLACESLPPRTHTRCCENFLKTAVKMFPVAKDGSSHTSWSASNSQRPFDFAPLRSIWKHHIFVDARQHADTKAMGLSVCDGKRGLAALPMSRTPLSIFGLSDGISLPILESTHNRRLKVRKPWRCPLGITTKSDIVL
jgi:hypothetical protein